MEARLDYWREQPLFHLFHDILHKAVRGLKAANYTREGEIFVNTHLQMINRYHAERRLMGLPKVVPLRLELKSAVMGPGYKAGYFGKGFDMGDRMDDCKLSEPGRRNMSTLYKGLLELSKRASHVDYEEFAELL